MEQEKIVSNDATDKDLIFKIYEQLIQLNGKKKKKKYNPIEKWAKDIGHCIDISPKKIYRWPKGT